MKLTIRLNSNEMTMHDVLFSLSDKRLNHAVGKDMKRNIEHIFQCIFMKRGTNYQANVRIMQIALYFI